MRRIYLTLFLVFGAAFLSSHGFGRADSPRSHSVSVDDYFSIATPFELALLPTAAMSPTPRAAGRSPRTTARPSFGS